MHREIDIPKQFYSAYTDRPFVHCIDCGVVLLESEDIYSIIKDYVHSEVVFEMAICLGCAGRLRESYSRESLERINGALVTMFREAPSVPEGVDLLDVWEEGVSECLICQKSRSACRSYEVVTACTGSRMLLVCEPQQAARSPFMICDDCGRQLNELISKETRDSWNRFVEEHYDGPPGIESPEPHFEPILF